MTNRGQYHPLKNKASISGGTAALSNGTDVEEGDLCHGRRVRASGNQLNINYSTMKLSKHLEQMNTQKYYIEPDIIHNTTNPKLLGS